MGRITRAKAAEVAEKLHVDEDAVLELPSDDLEKADIASPDNARTRTPLGEVSVNSAGSKVEDHEAVVDQKKPSKSKKGGKKGRKGKKANDNNNNALDASTSSAPDLERDGDVLPDEVELQPSPASRAASEDLMKDIPELDTAHLPADDIRPSTHTPPSNAVRLTRSQLRSQAPDLGPVEPKSLVGEKKAVSRERPNTTQDAAAHAVIERQPQHGSETQKPALPADTPVLDDPFTMPNHVQAASGATPAKSPAQWKLGNDAKSKASEDMDSPMLRIISNEPSKDRADSANGGSEASSLADFGYTGLDVSSASADQTQMSGLYDQLEKAVVDASTPPKSERVRIPVIPVADPTYDELEAAAAALTATTPPQTRGKRSSPSPTQDAITAMDALDDEVEKVNAEVPEIQTSPEKPKTRKVSPVVRTTKASQARISLAHGPKDASKAPALGRPRQSSARQSSAQSLLTQSTAKRVTSTSSAKSNQEPNDGEVATEKKEVNIPHSKPRPMSLQFPTPPPPPKSTKAPTKSTFQLPGEAIAAKLKAAKEARLQKEAEDRGTKKTFKARPAPSFAGKPPPAVRQTSTSKARESMISGKPLISSTNKARPHSVATTRPTTSKASTVSKPAASIRPAPKVSSAKVASISKPARPVSGVPPQAAKTLTVTKRPSTVMGTLNKPRASLAPKPNPPATAQKSNGTAKGKEVFNRAAQAKSNAEKEKREKEEAAKKARAAAAERGRQASRDWAEKQRLKKLGLKPEAKPAAAVDSAAASEPEAVPEVPEVEETIAEPVTEFGAVEA